MEAPDQDDEMFRLVTDVLMPHVLEHAVDDQPAIVQALPDGLRGLWGVWMVHGQVCNGGFMQFFWNLRGRYVDEAREGYQLIGAGQQQALLDEAVRRFEQNAADVGRPESRTIEEMLAAFSERAQDGIFDDLDSAYYQLDTLTLMSSYIAAHPDQFVL